MDAWILATPVLFLARRRFLAGSDRTSAILCGERLPFGITPILNRLGENVRRADEVKSSVTDSQALLRELRNVSRECRLSLKLSQLGLALPSREAFAITRENLFRIASLAAFSGVHLEIDIEHAEDVPAMIALSETLAHRGLPLRTAIAARRHRAIGDARLLLSAGIPLRVVKGAYREAAHIASDDTQEIRSRFLNIVDAAFQARVHVAAATHDRSLIDAVCSSALARGVDQSQFEFQFLHGMRPRTQRRLLAKGYAVSRYIPYGAQWRAYGIRRWRFFFRHPAELVAYLFG